MGMGGMGLEWEGNLTYRAITYFTNKAGLYGHGVGFWAQLDGVGVWGYIPFVQGAYTLYHTWNSVPVCVFGMQTVVTQVREWRNKYVFLKCFGWFLVVWRDVWCLMCICNCLIPLQVTCLDKTHLMIHLSRRQEGNERETTQDSPVYLHSQPQPHPHSYI